MKSRLFSDSLFNYTPNWTIWSSKFQKFSGEGLTEPPPQTPPPLFLGLRPRFGLHPQISGASRPRFGLRPIQTPELLKRGCALAGLWLANFVRRQVDQRIQKPNPPPKIGQFQHCPHYICALSRWQLVALHGDLVCTYSAHLP